MLRSNLKLSKKIGSNKNIRKGEAYHQISQSSLTTSEVYSVNSPYNKSVKYYSLVHHEHTETILPIDNEKELAEQLNNEKLLHC